ncbi:Zinc finger protein 781 [Lemmus lemmus]
MSVGRLSAMAPLLHGTRGATQARSRMSASISIKECILEKSLLNAKNVGKLVGNPSASAHSLPLISEFTREKSLMNVRCVVKRLHRRLTLHNTRKPTQERNHMNVRSVARPLARRLTSFSIRGFIPGRSPISVWSVGRPLVITHPALSTRGFTPARGLMSVWNVGRPSRPSHPLSVIVDVTLERNLTSVVHVAKPLVIASPLAYIREFILGRNRMNVRSVGKPSFKLDTLTNIRESTLERERITIRRAGRPSGISKFILESHLLTLLYLPRPVRWMSSPNSSGIHPHFHHHNLKILPFPHTTLHKHFVYYKIVLHVSVGLSYFWSIN